MIPNGLRDPPLPPPTRLLVRGQRGADPVPHLDVGGLGLLAPREAPACAMQRKRGAYNYRASKERRAESEEVRRRGRRPSRWSFCRNWTRTSAGHWRPATTPAAEGSL